MTRHLLRLGWNRKRSSALLMLEIFASFVVVFAVAALGLFAWSNARRPLGFSFQDVWMVSVNMQQLSDDFYSPEQSERFFRLLREARSLEPVEAVAGALTGVFSMEGSVTGWEANGREVSVDNLEVTADYAKVLGIEVVAGRWFEPSDHAQPWRATILSQDLARATFGDEDPLGKPVRERAPGATEERVVGVVADFRRGGELAFPGHSMFQLIREGNPDDRPGRRLLVKVRPGTPVAFEDQLIRRLRAVAPDWSFGVEPLAKGRESAFRFRLTPILVGSLVAFFLLLMVALGLTGVLWQNLLRRTREIGLRRAAGASRTDVIRQLLLEQGILTGLAVLFGLLLILQLPLLGVASFLGSAVFSSAVALAVVTIFLLTAASAAYPSWLASRVEPAEAMRYE